MNTLTKADLVERVKDATGLPRADSVAVVEQLLAVVKTTLTEGESLKVAGFGTFQVRRKAARKGRNPQTAEPMMISERSVVSFKPSRLLRAALNPVNPKGR